MHARRSLVMVFLTCQALAPNLWAATYYVHNTHPAANDNNVGTQQAPWKKCPGMAGWTGTATLRAGDSVFFNNSGTWTQPGTATLLSVSGGVTYDGRSWGTGSRAIFRMLADNVDANRPGVIAIRADHATSATVVRGFEVDGNNRFISGITVNWPASSRSLTGAVKRIDDCVVHNFGDPGGSTFGIYGVKVGANGSYTTQNVEILNSIVHTTPRSGIAIYDATVAGTHAIANVLVRGCEAYNCGSNSDSGAHGGLIKNYVTNATFEYNYFHDNMGRGIGVGDSAGIRGPQNAVLRYNVITGNGKGGIVFMENASKSADLYGNLVFRNRNTGSGGSGIYFESDLGEALTVRIFNNTLFENANGEVLVSSAARFTTFELANNVFSAVSGKVPLVNNAPGQITVHAANIYFRPGGGTLVVDGSSYQAATLGSWESTALAANPLLKDVANLPSGLVGATGASIAPNTDGLSLTATSPARDAGIALDGAYHSSILGVLRPAGAQWDIGAYEYDPGAARAPAPVMNLRIAD